VLNWNWKRLFALAGAVGIMALGAMPAAAQSAPCAETDLYFSWSDTNLMQEAGSNIWSSPLTISAFCKDEAHPIVGATITRLTVVSNYSYLEGSIQPGDTFIGLTPWGANLEAPANVLTDTSGHATVTLRVRDSSATGYLADALDASGKAAIPIGLHIEWATATGDAITGDGTYLLGAGTVFAATPELDSLALFGTGAMGMAGYAMMRFRARRRG
jgi:hypothetical protein